MAKQSLFSACKRVFRDGISGTYTVGNNDIFLELYSQQDIDQNNEIGNSSEENIVVVAGDTITIPESYTLTPVKPKKSLVVICNTLINNGIISMYQKAPNVLPHDLMIIDKNNFGNKDIIIPAYANNQVRRQTPTSLNYTTGINGTNGANRNCGSGGTGSFNDKYDANSVTTYNGLFAASGSGYAFGGGAGGGGTFFNNGSFSISLDVSPTYPMRGASGASFNTWCTNFGGAGNPAGSLGASNDSGDGAKNYIQNTGCGGRIIIFCNSFTNNGSITVNGTDSKKFIITSNQWHNGDAYRSNYTYGGASGAGAVDLFYTNLIKQGTITATGGDNFTNNHKSNNVDISPGKGGNGSITLTQWEKGKIIKPIAKYMSKENMVYFLTNYIQRLKQGED